jgi:hypothetical protein
MQGYHAGDGAECLLPYAGKLPIFAAIRTKD